MRQIANNVYIPVLKDLVEEGKEVSMMISGSSMNPFLIHQRDYILMKKPEEELKAGDMVFFQRRDEAYVMHRIHHINKEGKLFIIGDAQVDMEGPIDKEQVFAICLIHPIPVHVHKVLRQILLHLSLLFLHLLQIHP